MNNNFVRMAASQDRESSVNDHFGKLSKFFPEISLGKLLIKIKFKGCRNS